jgi:predicted enzyme related to lactoylglutathione lyase
MARVIHFEIHADNPERAVKFYTNVFGWKFDKWEGPMPYWLVTTGPDSEQGINGGLIPRRGKQEGDIVMAYVCTVGSLPVDETVAKVLASGGQLAVPKMPIPGVGWLAYCKDTEGNIFGIMQDDKNAGM